MFIFTNIYFQRYILVREWEKRGCRSNSGRDTLTGVVQEVRNSILYVRDDITGKKKTVALDKTFSVEEV